MAPKQILKNYADKLHLITHQRNLGKGVSLADGFFGGVYWLSSHPRC